MSVRSIDRLSSLASKAAAGARLGADKSLRAARGIAGTAARQTRDRLAATSRPTWNVTGRELGWSFLTAAALWMIVFFYLANNQGLQVFRYVGF
ncbi:MAG: hypothetical protein GC150_08995 [Rhizobiales bacterium]|nr:hypothetical protein [Hyphomicrobiales bacterium]